MAGIGIIANPHSKLNKRNPRRQHLLSYIAGERGRLEITNNLEDLHKVACDFRERGIDILAINGGDGTISRTLTAFIHAYRETDTPLPAIALLRGGTMNMLADNLGIRGTPEQVLYRLIEAHSAGDGYSQTVLASMEIADTFGFLFASGTSARFLEKFYENKTGTLGTLWLVTKIALSWLVNGFLFGSVVKAERVSCTPSGRPAMDHASLTVFASTVACLPLKIRLFPDAGLDPESLQVVSVTYHEKEIVGKLLKWFVWQPEKPCRGKLRLATPALTLSYPEPFPYTLDGELYESAAMAPLAIKLGPKIRFVLV